MILEIPVPLDVPLFDIRTTLDGQDYLLRFDWNDRAARWYVSLFDVEEGPIYVGIPLVADWPLLRTCSDVRKPPGTLIALDMTGQGLPPLLTDLGRRVVMIYESLQQAAVTGGTFTGFSGIPIAADPQQQQQALQLK